MRRIISSSITIMGALALVVGASSAFFSDAEHARGNTFAAGVIDLTVDNESYYNGNKCENVGTTEAPDWQWVGESVYPEPGTPCTTSWELDDLSNGHLFFDFTDVKPDDEGEDTISLHVTTNDAWACMNVALTSDDDASSAEPELSAGDQEDDEDNVWDGELAEHLEFVWWADDGDNVLEDGEALLSDGVETLYDLATSSGVFSVALADAADNVWSGQGGVPLDAGTTYYVGKAWCLGTLSEARLTDDSDDGPLVRGTGVVCDGTTIPDVNMLQTDSAMLDVSFFTLQARHNDDYRCPEPETPPLACEITQTYADEVVYVDQGLRKNGTAVLAARSDTSKALGAPQSTGTPYDDTSDTSIANGFFSLGFPSTDPDRAAEIVLSFNDNYVVNATGTDLKLWEVTGGTSYPDEQVDVYVGNTPTGPWTQVGVGVTRDAELDLGSVTAARYVRIVDASNIGLFESAADGFDLDAVQALNCVVSPE